jgi:hypothetical protein
MALGAVAALASGCDSVMTGLVGAPKDAGSAQPSGPPPAPITTAFVADGQLTPNFAGQSTPLPPTLSFGPDEGVDEGAPAAAASAPRKPIAVAPLSADAAALAPLAAAIRGAAAPPDARYVLLVLAPPAADAAALDRSSALSRLSAAAAVRSLEDVGVAPDRVEISLATNPNAGAGEMRLYRR